MSQTVKQKIRFGTLFLFTLLLLSAGIGVFHIVRLKNDANLILQNNYESVQYAHTMLRSLDSLSVDSDKHRKMFNQALVKQENNITETNEAGLTTRLRADFERLNIADTLSPEIKKIRHGLHEIILLNMNAIEIKNQRATVTATKALTYITMIAGLVFVVGFSFVYNFPSVITGPINAFTSGIQEIAKKNYHHRIQLERTDEFGQMATAFNDMAARLEYFESSNLNQIIFQKSRAEAVINSLKDASIGIDKNGMVLFANNQALRLLNLQAADIVAKSTDKVRERNDLFRFLLDEKGSVPFKIVVDNRENYFVKEQVDIEQPDGMGSKVIVLRNITSFKELDVAKTNFIATISHELKTPLASSDFGLKLLEDSRVGKLTTEQQELVVNLKQDNQRMLRILSELLNMAQVESGKIQLDTRLVSPYEMMENAIQHTHHVAKEKNLTIVTDFAEGLPMVNADPEKTTWVVNNFLTNAIKHSPAGSRVIVALRLKDGQVRFSVQDQGPGIPMEYLSKVFERFFRIPGSGARGTGLGLSISKEFIEAQGGSIGVDSQPGAGSNFSFVLAPAAS